MSDSRETGTGDGGERDSREGTPAKHTYEAPRLIPMGNARDLLASSSGTKMDFSPPPANRP
jgi:hypothetical protein